MYEAYALFIFIIVHLNICSREREGEIYNI